jgi:hypothetical protein
MGYKEEQEYLKSLADRADETVYFLSDPMKPERERSVCIAFLRCLDIDFSADDIIPSEEEPPDIIFNSACFEVLEILDEGRKRHKEWKTKAARLKGAKTLEDNINLSKPRSPITYEEVISLITEALNKKSVRYGKQVCASLDALVYVNLLAKFLNPTSTLTPFDELWSEPHRLDTKDL